jgi:hypothetical protein
MPCQFQSNGCKVGCLHREMVSDYRHERARQEHAAELASIGYDTERLEYLEANPLITFKAWLIGRGRTRVAA